MKRDWLQLFTNIAVVIGVIVLIFEIRQTHFLTRVELISERQNLYVGRLYQLMGDQPSTALSVAYKNPTALTDEQKIVVDSYLKSIVTTLDGTAYMMELGVFDSNTGWQTNDVPKEIRQYLGFPYARDWWKSERVNGRYTPTTVELVDRAMDDSTDD